MLAKLLNRTFCNRTKPYRTCIFGDPFGDPLKLDKIGFGAVYIVLGTLPIMPKFVTPMPLVIFRQLKSPGFYPLGGAKGLYLRIRGASEIYILRYQDTSGNGVACLLDSVVPCRCPKLVPRQPLSMRVFQRASIRPPKARHVGWRKFTNRLKRQLPPPSRSQRLWICG